MSLYHDFTTSEWYAFLEEEGRLLVRQSVELYEREVRMRSTYHDYSFVIFPMAKAYEGFLKLFFFRLRLISEEQYMHRNFRIGRSLNPDVNGHQRDEEWLFDDVENLCSPELAKSLWDVWLEARNHLFHYFPDMRYVISLEEAHKLLLETAGAMSEALSCTIRRKNE